MRNLLKDGIPTRRGVMAIHEEAAYADPRVALPHTEAAAREVLMLPLFPDMTGEQQDHVVGRLAAHCGSGRPPSRFRRRPDLARR
jgi:perosamine synthetase